MAEQTPHNQVPASQPDSSTSAVTYIKVGLLALAILYVLFIIFLNTDEQNINFVFFTINISLIAVLILMFLIGAIVGYSLALSRKRKKDKQAAPKP